jgi:Fe(3+) dicitrate transport protein
MKVNFIFIMIVGDPAMRSLLLLVTALLLSFPARAEEAPRLSGLVLDETGAVVPGAVVTLRRAAVGFERSVPADAAGAFRITAPAGAYDVSATAEGFSVAHARVELGEATPELRLTLRPGVFSEEVTVVGARLAAAPESVRRIPGSVTVILTEDLETSRVSGASEALRKAPGLNVRDEEGLSLRPNIGVRGASPTRSSKVLLLEDGVPLSFAPYGDNASYYHPPIERFEGVEILKGSGQIGYGPVTVAGVINYITPGPPLEPSLRVKAAVGGRGYASGQAQAGGSFGATGLLFDYLYKRGDGARENTRSRLNDATLKAVLALGARQTLTLKATAYLEDSDVTYSGLREDEYAADPRANPFVNDVFQASRYGAAARHSALLGAEALLVTQLYAARFSRDWWRQSSHSGQRPNDAADPRCGGMANLLTTCGNEGRLRDYDQLGVEPRLRFGHRLLGARSEAELGLRAHFETQERRQQNGDTPSARAGRMVEDNRRENRAYSGFLQNRLLLGRLTVTPGVRFERVRYERTNRLARAGQGATGTTTLEQWVPGVGLAFDLGDRASLFTGLHRGFAPPRTEDVIDNATGGAADLEPERSWNVELGVRGRPHAGLSLEATCFRTDYENQVVPASVAGGAGATLTNGGETLHQGFELGARLDSGTWTGSRHNVFARAALTALPTARFEGARFSGLPGFAGVSVSGNRLPYAPETTVTAAIGYAHPSSATAQLELVHVGGQFADDLNSVVPSADGQRGRLPAYTIWNASLNVPVGRHLVAFASVKNLFDRLYVVDRTRGLLPGMPRVAQAGLSARF